MVSDETMSAANRFIGSVTPKAVYMNGVCLWQGWVLMEAFEAGAKLERERCAAIVDHICKEGGGTYGDLIRNG